MSIDFIRQSFTDKKLSYEQFAEQIKPYYDTLFEYADNLSVNELVESIMIHGGGVTVQLRAHNIKLCIPPNRIGSLVYKLLIDGMFENAYAKKMISCMEDKPVIFDIGANFGYYALLAGKTYPKAQVYAFEPIPDTYSDLTANINLNQLTNVVPVQTAISRLIPDMKISGGMFYSDIEPGASSLVNIRERNTIQLIEVPLIQMDDFCAEHNIYPDFIKVDVEGAELQVFQGASNVLRHKRPLIFTEILRKWCIKFGHKASDVVDLLKSYDYKPYVLRSTEFVEIDNITNDTIDTNFIFIP